MKLMDRLALQRLISMLLSFILTVIKLFVSKETNDETTPPSPKKRKLPWRNKK